MSRTNFKAWEERLAPADVASWVDRCVEHLENPDTYDYGGVTYLNIRNLIFNSLDGPHIDSYQVRHAVSRHPRLIGERPTRGYARMTQYRVGMKDSQGDGMAYLAISSCGCCSAVMSTGVESVKEEAKQVAEWIKDGRTVERMTVEQARERFKMDCPHDPKWGRAS